MDGEAAPEALVQLDRGWNPSASDSLLAPASGIAKMILIVIALFSGGRLAATRRDRTAPKTGQLRHTHAGPDHLGEDSQARCPRSRRSTRIWTAWGHRPYVTDAREDSARPPPGSPRDSGGKRRTPRAATRHRTPPGRDRAGVPRGRRPGPGLAGQAASQHATGHKLPRRSELAARSAILAAAQRACRGVHELPWRLTGVRSCVTRSPWASLLSSRCPRCRSEVPGEPAGWYQIWPDDRHDSRHRVSRTTKASRNTPMAKLKPIA